MAQIAILERKCTGCGLCQSSCPFGAIDMVNGKPELSAACKVCGVCMKNCPEKAVLRLETKVDSVDKSTWNDILVFAEVGGGRLHPGGLELIGKGCEMAQAAPGFKVKAVLVGDGVSGYVEELRHYGVDNHNAAQSVRSRSAYRSNGCSTWNVGSSGIVVSGYAANSWRFAPLVFIG